MNVLVVNPIVYTSEIKTIKRAGSIKDTMIYDLCLAFMEKGHQVVLYAAEPFKPLSKERYPFQVIWGKCVFQKICQPYRLPFMPGLFRYIKEHEDIDLIICSEVFSLTTLNSVWAANKKVIVWHELAEHNAMMHQIPSKIWYNIVPRLFMRDTKVVARSKGAYTFICQFCRSTVNEIIGHGVDLNRFLASKEKKDYFIVCSRLTKRKRIDGILYSFKMYVDLYENRTKLFIIGDGDQRVSLEKLTRDLLVVLPDEGEHEVDQNQSIYNGIYPAHHGAGHLVSAFFPPGEGDVACDVNVEEKWQQEEHPWISKPYNPKYENNGND